MVKRAHVIDNGIVTNTILVEEISDGLLDADQYGGGIGWLWDGVALTPPPAPQPIPPEAVSMRQARLALLGAGLLDTVDAAITQAGGAAKIEWEYATEVRRDAPLVTQMGQMLNIDDTQLDVLFITAGGL